MLYVILHIINKYLPVCNMSGFGITPKNLLLGVLQAGKEHSVPIKILTQIGELFGFSSNTIRVNVARLLSAGVLESDERGFYRIKYQENPLSQLVDDWHLGETRRRDWQQDWLVCVLPDKRNQTDQKKSTKALSFLGFKSATAGMWVRPNNLQLDREKSSKLLGQLGLMQGAILFVASDFSPKLVEQWSHYLWPVDELQCMYQELTIKLRNSKKHIQKLPSDRAVVEAFVIGSEAVNALAVDPLLPEEIMTKKYRDELTAAMKEYDALGKAIWNKKFSDLEMNLSPVHLKLVK